MRPDRPDPTVGTALRLPAPAWQPVAPCVACPRRAARIARCSRRRKPRPGAWRQHEAAWLSRTTALANRPHDVAEQVFGELAAHLFADLQRIAEMDAAPDPHHPLLFGYLRNTVELTLEPGIGAVGHREHLRRSGAEHRFEDA